MEKLPNWIFKFPHVCQRDRERKRALKIIYEHAEKPETRDWRLKSEQLPERFVGSRPLGQASINISQFLFWLSAISRWPLALSTKYCGQHRVPVSVCLLCGWAISWTHRQLTFDLKIPWKMQKSHREMLLKIKANAFCFAYWLTS